MYNLYKNIEILCDGKGENITQMCKIAGVPRGNLTDLKMGRQNGLSSKNLHKIAEHFGVTVEFLLTGENKKSPTSEDVELDEIKIKIINALSSLSLEDERQILSYIQGFAAARKE